MASSIRVTDDVKQLAKYKKREFEIQEMAALSMSEFLKRVLEGGKKRNL